MGAEHELVESQRIRVAEPPPSWKQKGRTTHWIGRSFPNFSLKIGTCTNSTWRKSNPSTPNESGQLKSRHLEKTSVLIKPRFHRVAWPRPATYSEYGQNWYCVLRLVDHVPTKDAEHSRKFRMLTLTLALKLQSRVPNSSSLQFNASKDSKFIDLSNNKFQDLS